MRILRVARFAARYAELGFRIARGDRSQLMRRMTADGEVRTLGARARVAGNRARARRGAPGSLLRGAARLRRARGDLPGGRCALRRAAAAALAPGDRHRRARACWRCAMPPTHAASNPVRFAVLTHDLGKARTPHERWPSHHGTRSSGVPLIEALCERLKVPNGHRELAVLTARHHTLVHRALELTARNAADAARELRRLPPPGALRRAAARLRGRRARTHRARA